MTEEEKIDPKHATARAVLRVLGPALALVGLVLIVIAMVSFFSAFGTFGPPRYFWCAFLGIPLLFVGLAMCQYGYFGSILRYVAGEAAPVQKDTFNYLAEGTQQGVRTAARAAGEGFAAGMGVSGKANGVCPHCQHGHEPAARYCSNCGTALAGEQLAP
jgi:uncharacterized membrane protein